MHDIELARKLLDELNLSLVIVKGGKTLFESHSPGINGLLQAIERLDDKMKRASVADRVVGKAATLLLVPYDMKMIYAHILSLEGLKVLDENGVPFLYRTLVPKILDKKGINICPFEQFAMTINNTQEAYMKLRSFTENRKFRKK
jgi:hypothetical protein